MTGEIDNRLAITFDIDWAPDSSIALCADICARHNVKATFFVTHDTAELNALRSNRLFELGIHPNFLPGSTQGDTLRQVLDHCFALVPEARSLRTHSLFQSSRLFELIADHYPAIETDSSLFLPFHEGLKTIVMFYGKSSRRLSRVPFYWEDDAGFVWPGYDWSRQVTPAATGIRVFNFHPIHVELNASSMNNYEVLKAELRGQPLQHASVGQIDRLRSKGLGARTFLENLIARFQSKDFHNISDLGNGPAPVSLP